ncbi:hypothetical protein M2451_003561 [Dysgonomonas sp. PFB1-18]|uniref:hypothetical protein n=1 Tax=unclassified Dysgonomonas TaxID=2630389 RepID=UPI0024751916|nr:MULTISPECIES: hypothetical protein [unclassified Dysgonomonas]MDH6310823.1 hypothetical protein [Dysgonomonas sp. PF1-14]MDH6340673.1 hypothetical protein [Dysgonomonas sp. PF1-16]MDH6382220.1 hypothetical protein [Dysgonomonas sp. PFB1-18]MDH6399643.1 hypothetical protein [Dysgonomonas sp. PF1-23]
MKLYKVYIILFSLALSLFVCYARNGSRTTIMLYGGQPRDSIKNSYAKPQKDVRDEIIMNALQSGDTTFVVNEVYVPILNGDTLFADTVRTRIYIDPSKSSVYYDRICDFSLDDESYYETPSSKKKKIPSDLFREWIPLHLYNGDYYLYAPCEWIIDKYKITDSVLIFYGWMDGDYGFSYDKITQRTGGYSIQDVRDIYNELYTELNIYIIDETRGIAVFEYIGASEDFKFRLQVRADKARQFPIVVHDCKWKQLEYEFEKPDYEALLKKIRK